MNTGSTVLAGRREGKRKLERLEKDGEIVLNTVTQYWLAVLFLVSTSCGRYTFLRNVGMHTYQKA